MFSDVAHSLNGLFATLPNAEPTKSLKEMTSAFRTCIFQELSENPAFQNCLYQNKLLFDSIIHKLVQKISLFGSQRWRERERDRFHPLAPSPNSCNSQARPKADADNSIKVSHVEVGHLLNWGIFCCLPSHISSDLDADGVVKAPIWDVSIPNDNLTQCSILSACHRLLEAPCYDNC